MYPLTNLSVEQNKINCSPLSSLERAREKTTNYIYLIFEPCIGYIAWLFVYRSTRVAFHIMRFDNSTCDQEPLGFPLKSLAFSNINVHTTFSPTSTNFSIQSEI